MKGRKAALVLAKNELPDKRPAAHRNGCFGFRECRTAGVLVSREKPQRANTPRSRTERTGSSKATGIGYALADDYGMHRNTLMNHRTSCPFHRAKDWRKIILKQHFPVCRGKRRKSRRDALFLASHHLPRGRVPEERPVVTEQNTPTGLVSDGVPFPGTGNFSGASYTGLKDIITPANGINSFPETDAMYPHALLNRDLLNVRYCDW